jgi:hypothetical protein
LDGLQQHLEYSENFAPEGWFPDTTWEPPLQPIAVNGTSVTVININGILFYDDNWTRDLLMDGTIVGLLINAGGNFASKELQLVSQEVGTEAEAAVSFGTSDAEATVAASLLEDAA